MVLISTGAATPLTRRTAMAEYNVGEYYWVDGLDMQCRPVRCYVQLIQILEESTDTGYDCIIKEDGVRVYSQLSDLGLMP